MLVNLQMQSKYRLLLFQVSLFIIVLTSCYKNNIPIDTPKNPETQMQAHHC